MKPREHLRKFVKTLELISKMRGRVSKLKICKWFITSAYPDLILQYGVINRTHSVRASKEYEFFQQKILRGHS
jgi:hypothetical protein